MLTIVTPGERLWEELRDHYLPSDGEQKLDPFRIAAAEGLQKLKQEEHFEVDACGRIVSQGKFPRRRKDIVEDYHGFFSYAREGLKDREIEPQRVFPGIPDLEEILQKEVHPPQLLPTIVEYTPAVGVIIGAAAGAVGGGHLFDYFFDNETVAYIGSGIGTVVGGIAGGFLAHIARLPLARYLSTVRKQQTQHAHDIYLQQVDEWLHTTYPIGTR